MIFLSTSRKFVDALSKDSSSPTILIVDEYSFCSQGLFECLDKGLQHLRCTSDEPYSGIHVIFIGDLHQLVPFDGDYLYSKYCIHWHELISTSIFTE